MNKEVVRRMIKRIESVPEGYDQGVLYIRSSDKAPCGTVACLAGEAVICSRPRLSDGLAYALKLNKTPAAVPRKAEKLLGLAPEHNVFKVNAQGWPSPFREEFQQSISQKERAQIAAAYLREALRRGAMVWDVSP